VSSKLDQLVDILTIGQNSRVGTTFIFEVLDKELVGPFKAWIGVCLSHIM